MTESLIFRPEFWATIGILLMILDITVGLDFFALAFGCGGLLTALILVLDAPDGNSALFALDDWTDVALVFGLASLLSLFPLRYFLFRRYREQGDINKY
jgi:membrane protein implicated in regulation of membrane protease activity